MSGARRCWPVERGWPEKSESMIDVFSETWMLEYARLWNAEKTIHARLGRFTKRGLFREMLQTAFAVFGR